MKPKKYPYSGSQKTDNKQDRVEFAEVLNYEPINVSIVVREWENSDILVKCVIHEDTWEVRFGQKELNKGTKRLS